MDESGDYVAELKTWFEANFPKEDTQDPPPNYPEDYEEDEPVFAEGSFMDILNKNEQLRTENARMQAQLEEAKDNGRKLMDAIHGITIELQRYQDATPLLYKLLTDLDLDEYTVGEYELLLSGDIATEHDELTMMWTLRRIPPPVPQ